MGRCYVDDYEISYGFIKIDGSGGCDSKVISIASQIHFLEGLQRQITAGIKGEELLNNFFERVKFRFDYYVLHDLHLYSTAWFQIDSLIVTPYYAIILEMKNIGGHIKIRKNHPQLERTLASGQIDYYKNPLAQVVEITDLLQDFLEMKNIELPISYHFISRTCTNIMRKFL